MAAIHSSRLAAKLQPLKASDRSEAGADGEVAMVISKGTRQKDLRQWVSDVLFLCLTLLPWILFVSLSFWGPQR